MNKIKTKLIHLLGGVTKEESFNKQIETFKFNQRYFDMGKLWAFNEVFHKAKSLYGKSPEQWCEDIYAYIINNQREHRERVNDIIKGKNK